MLIDIVEVNIPENLTHPYALWLRFEDDTEEVVDVAEIVEFTGGFAPLKDKEYFAKVRINSDIGTICWPNDAGIDPDVLYSIVTKRPLPQLSVQRLEAV